MEVTEQLDGRGGRPGRPRLRPGPLTLDELRDVRDDILRIAQEHDASNVRVFGSVARGEAGPDSDIDLLVDIHTDRKGFQYFGLLDDLTWVRE